MTLHYGLYSDDLEEKPSRRRFPRNRFREEYSPVEIQAGAIIPDPDCSDNYIIQAITTQGLRTFDAHEQGARDVQSDGETAGAVCRPIILTDDEIKSLLAVSEAFSADDLELGMTVLSQEELYKSANSDALPPKPSAETLFELNPDEVLQRLASSALAHEERRRLIIEAEAVRFRPELSSQLGALLGDFIRSHRESNDPADIVAVGSAIRKSIAILEVGEALAQAAELLDAGARSSVPIEVELELVKMIVRKLTANPPETSDGLSGLADRLMELASTYLNPRLLNRDKYAAVAINAALGLILTRSGHGDELLRLVNDLPVAWWRQQLARRSTRLIADLRGRFPEGHLSDLIHRLDEIAACRPLSSLGAR